MYSQKSIATYTKYVFDQFNRFINKLMRLFVKLFLNTLKGIHERTQKKVFYINKTFLNSVECIFY